MPPRRYFNGRTSAYGFGYNPGGPRDGVPPMLEMTEATKVRTTIGAITAAVCVVVAAAVWATNLQAKVDTIAAAVGESSDLTDRVTRIESSRFTQAMGAALADRVSAVERMLAANEPPQWFRAEVARLGSRLDSIEAQLRELERRP